MNCPPATRRLVMATLHQVQSRSGNSGIGAEAADLGVDVSLMGGILAKGSQVCQCARGVRNFRDKYLQCFNRSV